MAALQTMANLALFVIFFIGKNETCAAGENEFAAGGGSIPGCIRADVPNGGHGMPCPYDLDGINSAMVPS
jgi:hypothetical protein